MSRAGPQPATPPVPSDGSQVAQATSGLHRYTCSETLFSDGSITLYRARDEDAGCSVLLKVLDPRHSRPVDLDRLRHEHDFAASLDLPGVVRTTGLVTHEGMPALVSEDWGGEPLSRAFPTPMPLGRFLDLSVSVAAALGELHRHGIVHKDLKPPNIFVRPDTLEVKLGGLGLATRLPREQPLTLPPSLIEGSLPYMSPEQTGRTNNALDSRSDLYSLGVTFYELLTGRLPFAARDPLEWIHFHVARVPVPPSQIVADVPEVVAQIVTRLLAKATDDRYQTARGLQHDLARCRDEWLERGRVDPFPLGKRDLPDRLRFPQRLYGRDTELTQLVGALERVSARGESELVVVSGFSGTGKSTLVHELEGPTVAMVVCMSRRICVDLHEAIRKLRPQWCESDDDKGAMKVVMSGSASDGPEWQQHIRNKPRREAMAARFKNPKDPLRLVIVRDMWLTGFDAPCLHTLYVDKPMRGHGLMQAIARVNRVFRDKPGGLIVDYLGLAEQLRSALATYTESGGTGDTAIDQNEAVAVMLAKFEVCQDLFHGLDYDPVVKAGAKAVFKFLPSAQEHILKQEEGKERLVRAVTDLSKAFALAVPHEEAIRIRDEVAFFQAVKAALVKRALVDARPQEDLDAAVRQIVSRAVAASDKVIDIFEAAGLKRPDISILSPEFLAEVRGLPHRNLAVELLKKLLQEELKTRSKRQLVQARSFSEMLEQALNKYRNRAIETAQVIEELIELAGKMREAHAKGEQLGLTEDELAFYDALGVNDAAVKVMGDAVLRAIAKDLTDAIRRNVTIDWTQRETVRAKLRTMVKRLLRKHGYPPDKQEQATATVMEHAERLCETWAEEGTIGVATTLRPNAARYDVDSVPLPLAAEPAPALQPGSAPRNTPGPKAKGSRKK